MQVLLELILQARILRRFPQRVGQRLRFTGLLGKLRFNRRCGLGLSVGCRGGLLAVHATNKRIKISFAVLQRIHEEAQQGQLVGDRLEIVTGRLIVRLGKLLDPGAACLEAVDRAEMSQHGQRTTDLLHRLVELEQILRLGWVAEENIEGLLDLGQTVLNLPTNLPDQQLFLRLPRHFVEERNRLVARRTTRDASVQTGDHEVNLLREIGAQSPEVFLSILQEEDGRRHFHGDRVVKT